MARLHSESTAGFSLQPQSSRAIFSHSLLQRRRRARRRGRRESVGGGVAARARWSSPLCGGTAYGEETPLRPQGPPLYRARVDLVPLRRCVWRWRAGGAGQRTCVGTTGCVGKEPVFAPNNKRLIRPLCTVIVNFSVATLQKGIVTKP